MPQTIDRAALERLIARGRARGELGPDDLWAELPVDAMRVEDVALVILELEEAGVSVEPEAFGPARTAPAAELAPKPVPPPPIVSDKRIAAGEANAIVKADAPAPRAEPAPQADAPEAASVHRTVALAGLVTFLVLAAVLLLI